jgi:hypothetical protein
MPRGQGTRCAGYLSSDGRFAFCSREEHAGALQPQRTDPATYRHLLEGDCWCGTVHGGAVSPNGSVENWTPRGPAVAIYSYEDSAGRHAFDVCRTADKQFPVRQPDPAKTHGWRWSVEESKRLPFRLPRVLAAARDHGTVFIAEGEKDVLALERAGATATCNPFGAGKWWDSYSETLRGAAAIVVVADKDEEGRAHATAVSDSLRRVLADSCPPIRIVQAKTGKDAADHLAAGHGLDELEPVDMRDVSDESATPGEPSDEPPIAFATLRDFLKLPLPAAESLVGSRRGGTNVLPANGWMMLWGPADSSKTSLVADLAFHVACGRQWLRYPTLRPLRLIVIVNEGIPGGLQDKLAEKLELWDGDKDLAQDNISVYVSPWGEFTFRNSHMVDHLEQHARDFRADYIVLDPLHTVGPKGSGTPEETEHFKHLLRDFGLWNWIGFLTAHHSNKNGMVSGDWTRHPDTVVHVEKEPKRPATRYTLEKARPADPEEIGIPCILEWITESKGYKLVELDQREKVSDEELLERIYQAITDQPGITMTDLRQAVQGDDNRIGELVKTEIQAGRIANSVTRDGYYKLTVCNRLHTDPTESELEWR